MQPVACACARAGVALVALVVVGCTLGLATVGCGGSSPASGASDPSPGSAAAVAAGSSFTLMQMNLCLSGFAGCFREVAYPAGVRDAEARIRAERPDAVTLNEACRDDAAGIARRTGYALSFSRVRYRGKRLPCVRPGGRGLFGNAVLTATPVERTDSADFVGQSGPERRRWLCVTTRDDIDVCTAHLNTRSAVEAAGNDAQCPELAAILTRRAAAARAVVFGGDVNRRDSCAPTRAWTRTDRSARQSPGLQHVYGSGALSGPAAQALPTTHTDHDILLVRAHLAPRR